MTSDRSEFLLQLHSAYVGTEFLHSIVHTPKFLEYGFTTDLRVSFGRRGLVENFQYFAPFMHSQPMMLSCEESNELRARLWRWNRCLHPDASEDEKKIAEDAIQQYFQLMKWRNEFDISNWTWQDGCWVDISQPSFNKPK